MIFLRPWWLLALLIPFLFKRIITKQSGDNPWVKVIDKKLLAALTLKTKSTFQKTTLSKLALIFWGLGVLALAGPAWDKLPVPATQTKPNTIIVLDLNKELSAKQVRQIQIKLYDILGLLKEDRIGLVLYGENQGYIAMPLTPDTQLIENLIPSLNPSVIPDESVNFQAGIKKAEEMLNQTGGKGRILFVGKGNPKSNYPVIQYNPHETPLKNVAENLSKTDRLQDSAEEWSNQTDVWYDRGIWLALLCVIPALLLFRKNVLFLILILIFSSSSEAGFLKRPDQERYAIEQKGIQAYRSKDYQAAEQFFRQTNSPYNRGNALAFQGKIQEAIDAYQEALKQNPNDEEAKFNKEYLEKQLPKDQQKQEQQKENQKQQQSEQNNQENTPDNNQEKQNQENEKQQEAEGKNQQNQEQQESEEKQEAAQEQEKSDKKETQALEKEVTQEQFNQEEQQILNRLNRDPARVLRYRINLQHQKGF